VTKLCAALAVACALAGISTVRATFAESRTPDAGLQNTPRPSSATAFDVVEKSISDLQAAMRLGQVTSRQLVEAYLARIRKYDQDGPHINAFIMLNPKALETADALDAERRTKGPRGMLHGIPIVVKDNYVTEGMPTTGGSKALAGFESGRDAFMVKKLRDAGVVIVGKTNLHELAYGITTISSMGGQTRNPYDLSRNPGGSSGGTGAAVAANFAAAGMGTDTCGSIRIPSANNNLVGLRGTRGLSSRTGIIPLAMTQDIGGPLARTVTDLSIMLDATVGRDPDDPATQAGDGHIPASYAVALSDRTITGIRIGILTSLFGNAPEDQEVATLVRKALATFPKLGIDVAETAVPGLDDLLQNTSVINAEFKFQLMDFLRQYPGAPVHSLAEILSSGRYDPAVEGVFKRSEAVESRDAAAYRASLDKRKTVREAVLRTMKENGLTALAYPTLRRKAAPIGQPQGGSNCQLSATTDLPAMALPAGFTDDGVPVGFEMLGEPFSESTLLRVGYAYEQNVRPRRAPKSTP
jgi:Asp-tRNA(Asn)/Glu-tRNA(Gln) amidotransferase A subunit family amidase